MGAPADSKAEAAEEIQAEPPILDRDIVHGLCTPSLLSLLRELDIVKHVCTTNSEREGEESRDIVHDLCTCLDSARWPTVQYLLKHGAATAWVLRHELNMKKRTVYHNLELFRDMELVEPKTTVGKTGRMKRNAVIWGTEEATTDQIREAYQLHLRLMSPVYRRAEKLAESYKGPPNPTQRDLIDYLKVEAIPPRERLDLANMMRGILNEK